MTHGFKINAVRIIHIAGGIAHRQHFRAQADGFFRRIQGHVAAAGNEHFRAFKALVFGFDHVIGKIYQAVAGGLRAGQAAAVRNAFAG